MSECPGIMSENIGISKIVHFCMVLCVILMPYVRISFLSTKYNILDARTCIPYENYAQFADFMISLHVGSYTGQKYISLTVYYNG